MHTTHLLYLHGFRSSPQSTKAQIMAQRMQRDFPQVHWWCPQLPPSPEAAMQLILQGTAHWPATSSAVIGSSLGGFYATAVHQQRAWRTVLINPAVEPARDLTHYIGEQTAWHDPNEKIFFAPQYVEELGHWYAGEIVHPERLLALIAKGDEVLDWREMQARYANCQPRVLEGGDHALSDFETHLPEILAFLELC